MLERSQFGVDLLDPRNPLGLPGKMKFRDRPDLPATNPVFLTDIKIADKFSPYISTCTGVQSANNFRLTIERFFGRFTAINRFLMCRTWIEHNHIVDLMLKVAVQMYNYRLKMPAADHPHTITCGHDIIHVKCYLWCVHESPFRYDLSRLTNIPADTCGKDVLRRSWRDAPARVFEANDDLYDQEDHFDFFFNYMRG